MCKEQQGEEQGYEEVHLKSDLPPTQWHSVGCLQVLSVELLSFLYTTQLPVL